MKRKTKNPKIKEAAEQAAEKYVGHHEFVCGDGRIAGAFADGYRAGHKAATKHADILNHTIEMLDITIRSARRCAYDLNHCAGQFALFSRRADDAPSYLHENAKMYTERANYYIKLFQSGNAMKDYRIKLHEQIEERDDVIEKLRAVLAEHKIEDPTAAVF